MFPRVLKETHFLVLHPNVDLEIVEGKPDEPVGLLRTRVDFAVGPKDVNNGFLSRPLCRCKRVLLSSADPIRSIDLSSEPGTTELHLYQRQDQEMSHAAEFLMDAVYIISSSSRERLEEPV